MGRSSAFAVTLAFALLAFARPAHAQYQVATTALLVTSSHRDFAAARSAALKLQEKLGTAFDVVNRPSPSVGAARAWRSHTGEAYFRDANGEVVDYSPRWWEESEYVHVSIEDSSQLPGLVPGFFVVVIASGEPRTVWQLARRANAAGIRAHVRYSRRLFSSRCMH
jgi:hypothetical protein